MAGNRKASKCGGRENSEQQNVIKNGKKAGNSGIISRMDELKTAENSKM